MNEKQQLVSALRKEFEQWDALLDSLNEAQISTPIAPSTMTVKDTIAHLKTWQQRSIARLEAALLNRTPDFSDWPANLDPEAEEDLESVNAWIYANIRDLAWPHVYADWRTGFLRFLELAERIPEQDLLDPARYPWLEGYALADVLRGSYEHHHFEHFEPLYTWLQQHGRTRTAM